MAKKAGIFSQFRWGESYTSLFLGLTVVVVAIILIFSFGRDRQIKQTSSIQDSPENQEKKIENDKQKTKSQKTYVVKKGDDLWSISEVMYKSGYYWVKIANANNLTNPDLIFSDNVLKIPR